jgi:hypothetical protein
MLQSTILLRLLPILLLVGCGGAAFSFAEPTPDAGFDATPTAPDAPFSDYVADAAPEANAPDRFTVGRPDAGREAEAPDVGVDAPPEAATEVAPEASPAESGPVDAPHEADVCVVPAPFVFACGTNRASISAPSQYCVDINAGTSYQGMAGAMPPECTCSYTCACLLAHVTTPCQGRNYSGCSDTGGVAVGCQ